MKNFISFILLFFVSFYISSQIQVDSKLSPEICINDILVGTGIEVGEVHIVGAKGGLGQFKANSSIIGIESGLIMSTGSVDSVNGPNNNNGYTSYKILPKDKKELKHLRKGDRDLRKINRTKNSDISVIEFDFVPIKNKLKFNYVFASEEYIEYTGSSFNDVFAFLLSGPGIKRKINLAVLPDGETPISVNTINNRRNKKYFRKNTGKFKLMTHQFNGWLIEKLGGSTKRKQKHQSHLLETLQFDGLTTVLKVEYDVLPYHKYRMKLAIGDGSDGLFDSAVFLEAGSFMSVEDPTGIYFDSIQVMAQKHGDVDSILGINKYYENHFVEIDTIPILEPLEFTDIYFASNSFQIPESSIEHLDSIVNYLMSYDSSRCTIVGHTDIHGSKQFNQILSLRRATNVVNYIIDKGVNKNFLTVLEAHFSKPISDDPSKKEQAKNRRVEITIEAVHNTPSTD